MNERLHFNVKILETGDAYGLDDVLTADAPMIEFYDPRYDFTPLGQFVSRYYLSTLEDDREVLCERGLCLDGGVPAWNVSGQQMAEILETIDQRSAK